MPLILLLGKQRSFLVDTNQKTFSSQYGKIDLTKAKIGRKIKSSLGYEFSVVQPTILDFLRKCKRGPQIITPKDAAQIIAVTGVSNGWRCLDLGGGSGFLTLFLGNAVAPNGSLVTYEKSKPNSQIIARNIKFCGLDNVKVKNKDAAKFTEKTLDLITMDIPDAEKLIKKCYRSLKAGGWFCCYSPHIEQQIKVRKEMDKLDFINVRTMENIQRDWKSFKGYTHPRYGLGHTGFLTFGRKV